MAILILQKKTGSGAVWSISSATYNGANKTESAGNMYGMEMKPDGTKFFMVHTVGKGLKRFSMSTPWDITTESFDGAGAQSPDLSAQMSNGPDGAYFKSDGTKVYVIGDAGVFQYSLSTPWDISASSWSYDSKTKDISTQGASLWTDVEFNSDGTTMMCMNGTTNTVYQYTLSVAWDVSTALYASKSATFDSTTAHGFEFQTNGERMFMVSQTTDTVYQYALSTGWDISTANTTVEETFDLAVAVGTFITPTAIAFRPNGNRFFIRDELFAKLYEFDN